MGYVTLQQLLVQGFPFASLFLCWEAGELVRFYMMLCLGNDSSDSVFQSYFKHLGIESSETHYQRSFKNMITVAKEKEVWYQMS